jgi:hypothetical protein
VITPAASKSRNRTHRPLTGSDSSARLYIDTFLRNSTMSKANSALVCAAFALVTHAACHPALGAWSLMSRLRRSRLSSTTRASALMPRRC